MPYIKPEDRVKYVGLIEDVLILMPDDRPVMEQAVTLAYFDDSIIQALRRINDPNLDWVRHFTVGSGVEAKCRSLATELANTLPMRLEDRAGDLNFVLSSIAWGLEGDAPDRTSAKYCKRVFIKGAIWRALLVNLFSLSGEEAIFFLGVFTDIIDEMYRRKTAGYEDQKIAENGDLWQQ